MSQKLPLPEYINEIIERIAANGHEAYAVGGCVRDMLRGVVPSDYDMTTSALPEETAEIFSDLPVIKTGIKHGTVTVMYPDENGIRQPVEITTYRVDGSYTDNRHPESVSFTRSLDEDLCRRDFTVNAMAYNNHSGLVDIFGGRDDIAGRTVKCVGDPYRRFNEDGLRILRALRFASTLDFSIEAATSKAITDCRELLNGISHERILVELRKLLCGVGAVQILRGYRSVIEVFLHELASLGDDEYETAVTAVGNAPREFITRFSVLYAFLEESAAHDALRRLKSDTASVSAVSAICRAFKSDAPVTAPQIKRMCAKLGYDNALKLCDVRTAYGDTNARNVADTVKQYQSSNECISVKQLLINGEVLKSLGITGRDIGRVLESLLTLVIDGEIENNEAVLIDYAKKIYAGLP